jgi:hypothetical protein
MIHICTVPATKKILGSDPGFEGSGLRLSYLEPQIHMARWFRLAEWGQDEVVADPLPLSLTLENITLHIEDDRPPAAPGLPSAPPLDLSVPARLRVARDRFGVVNIGAEMTAGTVTERAELCPSKVNVGDSVPDP